MPEWIATFLTVAAGAGSVYGAIRYDLGRLHEKAETAAKTAAEAHKRIDLFFQPRNDR